jgi:hypothetical protein
MQRFNVSTLQRLPATAAKLCDGQAFNYVAIAFLHETRRC